MLIGMGGGAASSMATGVEHGRPRLRFGAARQCRDRAPRAGSDRPLLAARRRNPILSIHDVGAGGLSNALPELVHGGGVGGAFDLRAIPSEEPGMSPREIWCNEAQERYVLAIAPDDRSHAFRAICERERCPFAVVGRASARRPAAWSPTRTSTTAPVDMPLDVILGKPPKMTRDVRARVARAAAARPRRHRRRGRRVSRAAAARGRRQDVPRHDRRSHRRRPVLARPDGRPVAGAGGRRRGDAAWTSRATRARRWRSASARRSR